MAEEQNSMMAVELFQYYRCLLLMACSSTLSEYLYAVFVLVVAFLFTYAGLT